MHRAFAAGLVLVCLGNVSEADWPAWRGPEGIGVTTETDLPTRWSRTENVRWRTELPEPGNSTPVVWGDRIFVTQAQGERRTLLALDRNSGKVLWQRGVTTREREPTHKTNPYCSGSPVTDGERVIAFFASDGLYCYDFEGEELWHRDDLGRQIHIWGAGSSPTLYENLCLVNFGPGETTYLLAVDKTTGETVWKVGEETGYGDPQADGSTAGRRSNPEYIGSWTTPVIMPVEGEDHLLLSWPRRLAAYNPRTGEELWTCGGLNPLCYTSPVYERDIVVAMGGFNGVTIAVKAGGEGDVTEERRLWVDPKTRQRIGSGVVHAGHVYIHNDPGIAECFELKTGEKVWEERLSGPGSTGQNWSSVLLSKDLCYTINQGGDCFVFRASPKFELVAVNSLGETSNSSIVPDDGELLIRTHEALWCIGAGGDKGAPAAR